MNREQGKISFIGIIIKKIFTNGIFYLLLVQQPTFIVAT